MRKLQILMPMAGLGSRFAKVGITTPKPLIMVDGLPMFQKALTSFAGIKAEKRFLFVIRQEHADSQKLDRLILDHQPDAEVVIIPEMTRGAAETALLSEPKLDPDEGLVVMDCDIWFNSQGYNQMVDETMAGKRQIEAGLLTFAADNPRYSYAEVGEGGMVTRTAEKQVISPRAILGGYFFAAAKAFTQAAKTLLKEPLSESMPEYYISYLYNIILAGGGKVQAAGVDEFESFGTPEELAEYEKRQN
jgi:UDP-N-acetylglucosamine diphosphorylase / glucose-1-phosphate thymidylyltransferase / UDP-N-acetylgalactosamine diphosphorylase / glucosamine-1-phosphate N-acetyltransferase / galactosamine-1-phosphate N-acetyltransferase